MAVKKSSTKSKVTTKSKQKNDAYDESKIKTLEGLEGIRKRPTMYIGSIRQDGVFHLFREAMDNSLDEALGGYCNKIEITINAKDQTIQISDNGRGIPVGSISDSFLKIHTSGKFDDSAYAYSAGLNGVGNKAINALSDQTIVTVKREGKIHKQEFSKGKAVTKLEVVGKTKETGTSTFFHPDIEIMKDITLDINRYRTFVQNISFLNNGIKFVFNSVDDKGKKKTEEFSSKDGLKDFAKVLQTKPLPKVGVITIKNEINNIPIDIAVTYNKDDVEICRTFCNGIENLEGGTHQTGFRMGLSNVISKYIKDNNLIPKKEGNLEITGEDTREGIVAIISIKHKDALFSSQEKLKLTNTDVQGAVMKATIDGFTDYLARHKDEAKIICEKAIVAAKGRQAAKRARLNVTKSAESFSSISNLSKYSKCSSKNPEERELYITEGDSGGGLVVQARNPKYHSVYRLRGKPRNTHDLSVIKIMANKEFNDLSKIIGFVPDKEIDMDKINYHKIVLLSDADIDG